MNLSQHDGHNLVDMHLIKIRRFYKSAILLIFGVLFNGCLKTDPSAAANGTLPECSLNSATTSTCAVSTVGTFITRTSGSNVTSYTNSGAGTSITASIPNAFYSEKSVTFTDSFLLASNIKSGVTIFGVTGIYPGLSSTAYRDKNTTQLSSISESVTYAGLDLPATGGYAYRDIPKISKDDDGTTGGSNTYVNRSSPISWTGRTCGTAGTIEQRISDCATQLGSASTWSGTTYGNAGQATWKIVTRSADCTSTAPNSSCKEVWRDERTLLLWSSKLSEGINWCKASGNNAISGNPAADTDSSNYCDNGTYQATSGQAISACYDDNSTNFINTDAAITNGNGKGGLGKTSSPAVQWRLPSLHDYYQAEIDGIRYVMPDMGNSINGAASQNEWTASVLSTSRASAWLFNSYSGANSTATRNTSANIGVRCIGR